MDASDDALHVDILRLCRLDDRLVVHRQVIAHIRMRVGAPVHPLNAGSYNVRDLVAEGRIVRDDGRIR